MNTFNRIMSVNVLISLLFSMEVNAGYKLNPNFNQHEQYIEDTFPMFERNLSSGAIQQMDFSNQSGVAVHFGFKNGRTIIQEKELRDTTNYVRYVNSHMGHYFRTRSTKFSQENSPMMNSLFQFLRGNGSGNARSIQVRRLPNGLFQVTKINEDLSEPDRTQRFQADDLRSALTSALAPQRVSVQRAQESLSVLTALNENPLMSTQSDNGCVGTDPSLARDSSQDFPSRIEKDPERIRMAELNQIQWRNYDFQVRSYRAQLVERFHQTRDSRYLYEMARVDAQLRMNYLYMRELRLYIHG